MSQKKKMYLFIGLIIIFVIILLFLSKEWACGCDCGVATLGIKSYVTGTYYPKIYSSLPESLSMLCPCACKIKFRFPIEIIILEFIALILVWFLWVKKENNLTK